jgi:hypothetical protein
LGTSVGEINRCVNNSDAQTSVRNVAVGLQSMWAPGQF